MLLFFFVLSFSAQTHTLLLVDDALDVEVDADDDEIAGNVAGAAVVEHRRVIEGDSLGHLHHPEDDDQVRAAPP